jgi:hypothetical protein
MKRPHALSDHGRGVFSTRSNERTLIIDRLSGAHYLDAPASETFVGSYLPLRQALPLLSIRFLFS